MTIQKVKLSLQYRQKVELSLRYRQKVTNGSDRLSRQDEEILLMTSPCEVKRESERKVKNRQ